MLDLPSLITGQWALGVLHGNQVAFMEPSPSPAGMDWNMDFQVAQKGRFITHFRPRLKHSSASAVHRRGADTHPVVSRSVPWCTSPPPPPQEWRKSWHVHNLHGTWKIKGVKRPNKSKLPLMLGAWIPQMLA